MSTVSLHECLTMTLVDVHPTLSLHDEFQCSHRENVPLANREFLEDENCLKAFKGHKNGYDWNFIRCIGDRDNFVAHSNAIVIAVDGACRNNGQSNAQGAYAVYLGHDNPGNGAWYSTQHMPTNQRMELMAGIKGLETAIEIANEVHASQNSRFAIPSDSDGPLRSLQRVVIKTDSTYLRDSMIHWVKTWKMNGYISYAGTPVVNQDLFKTLESLINQLNEKEIEVNFWHVRRRRNLEPDRMANSTLDQRAGLR